MCVPKSFPLNGICQCISEFTLEQDHLFVRFATSLFKLHQILTDIKNLVILTIIKQN